MASQWVLLSAKIPPLLSAILPAYKYRYTVPTLVPLSQVSTPQEQLMDCKQLHCQVEKALTVVPSNASCFPFKTTQVVMARGQTCT